MNKQRSFLGWRHNSIKICFYLLFCRNSQKWRKEILRSQLVSSLRSIYSQSSFQDRPCKSHFVKSIFPLPWQWCSFNYCLNIFSELLWEKGFMPKKMKINSCLKHVCKGQCWCFSRSAYNQQCSFVQTEPVEPELMNFFCGFQNLPKSIPI